MHTLIVNSKRVAFYEECSDAEVRQLVTTALGLQGEVVARIGDSVVALNSSIPPNTELEVQCVESSFEREFVKFENIQAHLANERTWLAWVRTSLAALSVAFSLLGSAFLLGAGFVVCVFTAFLTGYLRYARVRDVLMLAKTELTTFRRLGLSYQAYFLGLLCALVSLWYIASAWFG